MTKAAIVEEISFADLESADTATMTVEINGRLSNWTWTFAGPGHQQTIDYNNRMQRDRLHRESQQEQARVNGKKWKAEEETVDEVRLRNVNWIVARLVGWSQVRIDGDDYVFSADNARALLLDPSKSSLFSQAVDFLADEKSFMQRSAAN